VTTSRGPHSRLPIWDRKKNGGGKARWTITRLLYRKKGSHKIRGNISLVMAKNREGKVAKKTHDKEKDIGGRGPTLSYGRNKNLPGRGIIRKNWETGEGVGNTSSLN